MSTTAPKAPATKKAALPKKQVQVNKMVDSLKRSKEPMTLKALMEKAGAKYSQDVNAAFFALEHVGLVKCVDGAYAWVHSA